MVAVVVVVGIMLFVGLGLFGWAMGLYNALVALKNQLDQTWSNIDVLLKQRRDELTKLIDTVKGAKDFEQATLLKVTQARNWSEQAAGTAQAPAAATAESAAIRGFFAVAEAYPQLKSNENFIQLQTRIAGIESQIADRREVFNDAVNTYNTRIAQFPDSLLAGMLGYQRHSYFTVAEADREDVKVSF